jgi:hypothetical protein
MSFPPTDWSQRDFGQNTGAMRTDSIVKLGILYLDSPMEHARLVVVLLPLIHCLKLRGVVNLEVLVQAAIP